MKKRSIILRVIPVLAVFLMIFPLLCYSQGTTGTLRGFVTEKGAEALPGVTIEINSPGMMGTRSAITDNRGAYRFPYLPPGRYDITAKIEGFGTVSKNNVSIQVGKTTTIDFELEQAGLEETITVTAAAPVIDSERSERSYTIPVDVLQELPVGARI